MHHRLSIIALLLAATLPWSGCLSSNDPAEEAENPDLEAPDWEDPTETPLVPFDEEPPGLDAFSTQGSTWDHLDLNWCLTATSPDLEPGEVVAAVTAATEEWERHSPLTLTLTGCADADIVVDFPVGDHGDGSPFDGTNGVLAHAFYPQFGGATHFDDDENWTTDTRGGNGQPIDLETVALHELGHALGLRHSATEGSVMFWAYQGTRRSLHDDDRQGIQSLYGSDDQDGDGWSDQDDCDDEDPAVHPQADEVCNGIDDDCDGAVPTDEGDADGDGVLSCAGDCDDDNAAIHEGADELCDGFDNDCDGQTDEDFADSNGDGILDCLEQDVDGDGWIPADGDCDDDEPSVHPGAAELCNGLDDDCDGQIPPGESDGDGDGARVCDGDCDDADAETFSGAAEVCFDEVDQDCDGTPDGSCGTFVGSEWISLPPNHGNHSVYVDFPSNASHVVPFLAVHTATEHDGDDQCEWTTTTTQLTGAVRFDLELEHCATGWYSNTWGFEAQAVVVAQVGSGVTSTSFELDTLGPLPGDHTLTGSTGWTGGGSQRVAVCSAMTADGQGDVDFAWACSAQVSGNTLSGSVYEDYGNASTWVDARIVGLGFGGNATAALQDFTCSPGSTVTVGQGAATTPGLDHLAFVLPTDWATGTNNHLSLGSTCMWDGTIGVSSCEVSCSNSGHWISGQVLFVDGLVGWR